MNPQKPDYANFDRESGMQFRGTHAPRNRSSRLDGDSGQQMMGQAS